MKINKAILVLISLTLSCLKDNNNNMNEPINEPIDASQLEVS